MNEDGKGGSGQGSVWGSAGGRKSVKKAGYLPSLGEGESPSGVGKGGVGEKG